MANTPITSQTILDVLALPLRDLELELLQRGYSTSHAKTMYARAFRTSQKRPMAPLPRSLDLSQSEDSYKPLCSIERAKVSQADLSVKLLVRLSDNEVIESVIMPEKRRITLCVSSQVGCRQGCGFCHTARMGLRRQLSTAEIVSQVLIANTWMDQHEDWRASLADGLKARVTNIVFMGMGEPLDNVEAVIAAIRILTDRHGLAIGMRHISVSTAGHIDGLKVLQRELPQVPVALSLHSPFAEQRSKLMPITKRFPLVDLVQALEDYSKTLKRSVLIQYTLISDVNDTLEHAEALVKLLANIDVKINLIPLNEIDPSRFRRPASERLQVFRDYLHQQGLRTMVRYSKGQDIYGACGQLANA